MAFIGLRHPSLTAYLSEEDLRENMAVPDCPAVFPPHLRNTMPMHWVPLDKPLSKTLDPERKRLLPLKLTAERRKHLDDYFDYDPINVDILFTKGH